MKLFRDYAIITLDDDMAYQSDLFLSFFNSYIENPNLISGRRSHMMTYKNNGELLKYSDWNQKQRIITKPSFDIFLTGCSGIIYPPDILNINDDILPIINETITNDDFTLKYLATQKGITSKWISSNKLNNCPRMKPKTQLIYENSINNNIYINKLNIIINKIIVKNICAMYKNIQTGMTIYLLNIHNKNLRNNKLYFDLIAYSYCPIDINITFDIYFNNNSANCYFNESKKYFSDKNNNNQKMNIKIATCYMNESNKEIDDYYFPRAISKDNQFIKIFNYKKYLTTIFKSFICQDKNSCDLKVILLCKINTNKIPLLIDNKEYLCNSKKKYYNEVFPIIQTFKCSISNFSFNIKKSFISGLPSNEHQDTFDNDIIPNKFIISRIVIDNLDTGPIINNNHIIIIGKLNNNLEKMFYKFRINFLWPNLTLECKLKPYSKYVQSKIYCFHKLKINEEILIENQIIRSIDSNEELLLINEETLINIKLNSINAEHDIYSPYYKILKNYEILNKKEQIFYEVVIYLSLVIISIKIKLFF